MAAHQREADLAALSDDELLRAAAAAVRAWNVPEILALDAEIDRRNTVELTQGANLLALGHAMRNAGVRDVPHPRRSSGFAEKRFTG